MQHVGRCIVHILISAPLVHNLTVDVQWRSPYGHLSAIDYPLLRFYAFMWLFYAVLAIIWLVHLFPFQCFLER